MDVSWNRHTGIFLRTKLSTDSHSAIQLSTSILPVKEKLSPSILPIPKSGYKTPWIGYFRFGCARDYKRGLKIMGIGVINIDNHECMTLDSIQIPDSKTLDSMDKNLEDWYSGYLISKKEQL